MKNQALFSSKDKSKKIKCRLLQFLFGALRVKISRAKHKPPLSFTAFLKCISTDSLHVKTNKVASAPSEDSDQLRRPPSLISLRCELKEKLRVYASSMLAAKTEQTGRMLSLI